MCGLLYPFPRPCGLLYPRLRQFSGICTNLPSLRQLSGICTICPVYASLGPVAALEPGLGPRGSPRAHITVQCGHDPILPYYRAIPH